MPSTTLSEFFGITVTGFWDDILGTLRGGALLSELKDKLTGLMKAEHWPNIAAGIGDKVGELFEVDLAYLLVNAWRKYGELKQYTDPSRHPPEETNLVPLGKHTLKIGYSPYVEALFNGKPVGKLAFDVKLTLELEGFVLTIRDGRIWKVRTGECQGSGRIEFAGHPLLQRKLTRIELPGSIDFGAGISLGHREEDRQLGAVAKKTGS